jgi:hypothetical protein
VLGSEGDRGRAVERGKGEREREKTQDLGFAQSLCVYASVCLSVCLCLSLSLSLSLYNVCVGRGGERARVHEREREGGAQCPPLEHFFSPRHRQHLHPHGEFFSFFFLQAHRETRYTPEPHFVMVLINC